MQGLTETGARKIPHGFMPAHLSRRFYARYMRTLVAIMVPAMLAGMVTGYVMADAKGKVEPIHDLAQRVEMLRYAQTKAEGVLDVRTSAVHEPIVDVAELTR